MQWRAAEGHVGSACRRRWRVDPSMGVCRRGGVNFAGRRRSTTKCRSKAEECNQSPKCSCSRWIRRIRASRADPDGWVSSSCPRANCAYPRERSSCAASLHRPCQQTVRPPWKHSNKHRHISTAMLGSLWRLRCGGSDDVATTCARAGYGPPQGGAAARCGQGAPLVFEFHLLFGLRTVSMPSRVGVVLKRTVCQRTRALAPSVSEFF